MVIGICSITLHLPGCHSLKEKRQSIKSILARVRNKFEVAIAEVDNNDLWQLATLGISCVSNQDQHARETLENVIRYIEENYYPDVTITDTESEIMPW